jgi:hypothetical protein
VIKLGLDLHARQVTECVNWIVQHPNCAAVGSMEASSACRSRNSMRSDDIKRSPAVATESMINPAIVISGIMKDSFVFRNNLYDLHTSL